MRPKTIRKIGYRQIERKTNVVVLLQHMHEHIIRSTFKESTGCEDYTADTER